MTNHQRTRSSRFACAALPFAAALALLPVSGGAQVLGPPPSSAPQVQPQAAEPSQTWRQVMSEMKLSPRGELVRKKHHAEVDAIMSDGRAVTVSFDLQGRIWEIEAADHDKARYGEARPLDANAALEAVRRAGFRDAMLRDTRRHHAVVRARTNKGETVDLHVDRGGVIYKQVWVYETGWVR